MIYLCLGFYTDSEFCQCFQVWGLMYFCINLFIHFMEIFGILYIVTSSWLIAFILLPWLHHGKTLYMSWLRLRHIYFRISFYIYCVIITRCHFLYIFGSIVYIATSSMEGFPAWLPFVSPVFTGDCTE